MMQKPKQIIALKSEADLLAKGLYSNVRELLIRSLDSLTNFILFSVANPAAAGPSSNKSPELEQASAMKFGPPGKRGRPPKQQPKEIDQSGEAGPSSRRPKANAGPVTPVRQTGEKEKKVEREVFGEIIDDDDVNLFEPLQDEEAGEDNEELEDSPSPQGRIIPRDSPFASMKKPVKTTYGRKRSLGPS